jgi:hypothetical protein
MICSSIAVIAAMLIAPLITVQQSSTGNFSDSELAEIEKTFSGYNQALVEKKYEELTRYVQVPFVAIDSTPRIITEISAVLAGLRRTRESLDQA